MEDYWEIDAVLMTHEVLPHPSLELLTLDSPCNLRFRSVQAWLARPLGDFESGWKRSLGFAAIIVLIFQLIEGKRVELPYWLCEILHHHQLIDLHLPPVLQPTMRSNLTVCFEQFNFPSFL